jgi:threonine/homoserine/homoserine lactone efflux protein
MALDLIVIGLAITLYPLPLTAFIIVLSSQRGVRKGAAFVIGWLASLGIIVAVTVLATGNSPPKSNTAPAVGALVVKLLLGVVLVLIAFRQRRRMAVPKPPKPPPKWQASVDSMSLLYAAALAPLLQPWAMIAAGVTTITKAKITSVESALLLVFFCLLASASLITLELYAALRPEPAKQLLTSIRKWFESHTDVIIVVVCAALGTYLIGDSLYLLIS